MKNIGGRVSRLCASGLLGVSAIVFFGAAAPVPAHYGQNSGPDYIRVSGLFGDSDEEIAARKQHEDAQDASIANLSQRVSDLEHSLRQLTGQLEEANHGNALLQQKIERMQRNFDYRLCKIAASQLGDAGDNGDNGGADDSGALDCGMSGGAASAMPSNPSQAAVTPVPSSRTGRQSGVLGTLPAGTPMPQQRGDVTVNMNAVPGNGTGWKPAPSVNSAPAPAGNHAAFNSAMDLLAKAQYDEARSAFRNFADTYPNDDLAPQAVYWIGSIAYVQKDYPGAAHAFAEEIKEYPDSPRGPESMLKLGRSLIAMDQKQEGCTTLGALRSKYPKASETIRREASRARRDAHCR